MGWIGNQQVKVVVPDLGKGGVLIDQGIAVADVDLLLTVHEGRDLGDLGQAVFLFKAVNGLVVFDDINCVVPLDQGFDLHRQFVEEVARTTGIVNGLGRSRVVLNQGLQRQTHEDEAADRHRSEILPLALLDALVGKPSNISPRNWLCL